MKILVVDDSAVMRKIIIRTIGETKFAGASIVEAADGLDACGKFVSESPDWVLSDWNMPNMNGIDFVRKVRQVKTTQHVPIIMITTEGTMGKMEEALNEGVDSYVVKPFTGAQLERVMDKVEQKMSGTPQ